MELQRSNIVSSDLKVYLGNDLMSLPETPNVYFGKVNGYPGSVVSLSKEGDKIAGQIILSDSETLFIDTIEDGSKSVRSIIYTPEDLIPQDETPNSCTILDQPDQGPRLTPRVTYQYNGKDCPVAIIADYSFYKRWGTKSLSNILAIMNDVDAIYQRDFNLSIPVKYVHISTNATGPLSRNYTDQISSYLNYFTGINTDNSFPGYIKSSYCLVHLFTFQKFEGTLGLAWVTTKF